MTKFEKFLADMKGKTVSLVGVGISNKPLIRLLVDAGAKVVARDKKQPHLLGDLYQDMQCMNVTMRLGEDYLADLREEIIFKSPGIRFDLPEFVAARSRGSVVTSEMECFFDVCPAKIIAVTGSQGKSTTTTLIHKMLKDEGHNVWLGGNIGIPLLSEAGNISANDIVVLELSSFQLHTMNASPHVAVVTNISPNHLDMHTSMNEYVSAKTNIFLHQSEDDILILNADNPDTVSFAENAKGNVLYFSRLKKLEKGFYVDNGSICYDDGKNAEKIVDVKDILLPGQHNVENFLAAIAAVNKLVKPQVVRDSARTFAGVAHRMEFVRELNGIKYFNDSKATTPSSTEAALRSFEGNAILIAGGYDKHIPFGELGKHIAELSKAVVLIGETAGIIKAAICAENAAHPIYHADDLHKAVLQAQQLAETGDVVLLSPACASFDMFPNFEARGDLFKHIVMEL